MESTPLKSTTMILQSIRISTEENLSYYPEQWRSGEMTVEMYAEALHDVRTPEDEEVEAKRGITFTDYLDVIAETYGDWLREQPAGNWAFSFLPAHNGGLAQISSPWDRDLETPEETRALAESLVKVIDGFKNEAEALRASKEYQN